MQTTTVTTTTANVNQSQLEEATRVEWQKRKAEHKAESRKVWKSQNDNGHTHECTRGHQIAEHCNTSLFSFPLLCRFCYLPSCILAPWHMKPPWGGSERTKVQKPLGNFINNKLSDALMTWKYTYMTRQASHVQTASYKKGTSALEQPAFLPCLSAFLPCLPACSIQNAPLSLSAKRFCWQNSFFLLFFFSLSFSLFTFLLLFLSTELMKFIVLVHLTWSLWGDEAFW